MPLRVTLIHGGGISKDIVPAVRKILDAAGVQITFDEFLAGGEAELQGYPPLPDAMLESVRKNGLALKTKLHSSPDTKRKNHNIELRRKLGLYASLRPLKNLKGLASRFTGVDLLVIRELTEDLYTSIEHEIVPGVVQSIKIVTEAAIYEGLGREEAN